MHYPGSVTVKAKDILDVPESALNKNYLNDVINLSNLVKNTKQRYKGINFRPYLHKKPNQIKQLVV